MSAVLTAQPGLHRAATAVSTKAKSKGKNRKRKKNTMTGGACATMARVEGFFGDRVRWQRLEHSQWVRRLRHRMIGQNEASWDYSW